MTKKIWHNFSSARLAGPLLICIAAVLVYLPGMGGSFHFDDIESIVENSAIRDIGDPEAIWNYNHRRFLGYFTFAANYALHGLDVTGYHVFNLLIHIGTALMVWRLTLLLIATPALKRSKLTDYAPMTAVAAGLLFALHPVQTQAVTYIVQRLAAMAAFFYITAVTCYLVGRLKAGGYNSLWFAAAAIAGVAGIMTKENVVTLPFAILATEVVFFTGFSSGVTPKPGRKAAFAVAALAFILILPLLTGFHPGFYLATAVSQRHGDPMLTPLVYFITQFRVIPRYLALVAFPIGQNIDHDISASAGLFSPSSTFAGLVFIIGIIGFGARVFRRNRIAAWAVAWFFITLSVESSFKPLGNVMFEHRLYLPMAGLSILAATIIQRVAGQRNRLPFIAAVCALSLLLGVTTARRNMVWKSEMTLWADAVGKSPRKARPAMNLGHAYEQAGDHTAAIRWYRTALEIAPTYIEAWNNLGIALWRNGDIDGALGSYRRAIALNAGNYEAWNNMANALFQSGRANEALEGYQRALELKPDYTTAALNYASALVRMGRSDEAISVYREVSKREPGNLRIPENLATALFSTGDYAGAAREYSRAIENEPRRFDLYNKLGVAILQAGDASGSIKAFDAALSLKKNPQSLFFIGVALKETGNYREAVARIEESLTLAPENVEAHLLAAECYRALGDTVGVSRHIETARSMDAGTEGTPR